SFLRFHCSKLSRILSMASRSSRLSIVLEEYLVIRRAGKVLLSAAGSRSLMVAVSCSLIANSASLGFEPRQRDPESLVLPLHHEAMSDKNKDRSVQPQVAQLPSRMNLRDGDLLCFEQEFAALLGSYNFHMASALHCEFASGLYHRIYHLVVM